MRAAGSRYAARVNSCLLKTMERVDMRLLNWCWFLLAMFVALASAYLERYEPVPLSGSSLKFSFYWDRRHRQLWRIRPKIQSTFWNAKSVSWALRHAVEAVAVMNVLRTKVKVRRQSDQKHHARSIGRWYCGYLVSVRTSEAAQTSSLATVLRSCPKPKETSQTLPLT